jgi:hypothetical protein
MNIVGKRAISVTLHTENLTWLRARTAASGARSVSALLDRLVADARGQGTGGQSRSVVGTIDLDPADPLLLEADAAIRTAIETSIGRPLLVNEARARYRKRPSRRRGRS